MKICIVWQKDSQHAEALEGLLWTLPSKTVIACNTHWWREE